MSSEDPYDFDGDSTSEGGDLDDDDMVNIRFENGHVVVAKVDGHPYWPAMVDIDPDTNEFYWVHGQNKNDATHYHVVFFEEGKVTRQWIPNAKIANYTDHYPDELTETELRDAAKLPPKKRNLLDARRLAEEAMRMNINDRIEKFSFLHTYKGKITVFNENKASLTKSSLTKDREPRQKRSRKSQENTVRLTKDGRICKKPGPKVGSRRSVKSNEVNEPSNARHRRSIATSEPSKSDLKPDERQPARNSEPAKPNRSEPHSLKLRITKDKSNGKRYSSVPVTKTAAEEELNETLSQFAHTFPPSPETEATDMPKKRGRKRKGKRASKKPSKKSSVIGPRSDAVQTSDIVTLSDDEPGPSIRPSTSVSSSHASPNVDQPPAQEHRQIGVAFPFQQVPPEETMEYQMSSVLERAQSQQELPARLLTNKTVSNVGLIVSEDSVVDLTAEDDEAELVSHSPWQVGEVVFAHLNGLQPWPAVVDVDPSFDNNFITPSTGPQLLHVVFLELKKDAWVPLKNVVKFTESLLEKSSRYSIKFEKALQKAKIAIRLNQADRIAEFGASNAVIPDV